MSLIGNNAIGWANLQISGGWRRIAWVCGLIAVGVPLLIFGGLQLNQSAGPQANARALAGWYTMLGAVQGGLLLIGVPSRVHAAIKRDRTTKVIESHRLMPTPAAHAMVGYIVGANLLLLSCIGTVFAIGAVVAVGANEDWRGWVALHAAALGVSVLLCCLIAFAAQWLPRFNPAVLTVFIGPMLGTLSAGALLPPLRILFAPYFGSGFAALRRGEVLPVHVVGFGSQALIGTIFFIGACRRYRRDDVPALGFGWGFVLLTTWVAMGLIGALAFDDTNGRLFEERQDRLAFVLHATLTMLLAIGPIVSAAGASLRWHERKRIDPYFSDRRPASLPAAALCVAFVLCAMLIAAPDGIGRLTPNFFDMSGASIRTNWLAMAMTGAQFLLFVATIALLARGSARLRLSSVAWLIVPWVFLTWIVPPVLDASAAYVADKIDTFPHALGSPSPPVCLSCIWTGKTTEAEVGLLTQGALIVLLMVGWSLIKRTNGQRMGAVVR